MSQLDYTQLGAVAIIFIYFIGKFFEFLKFLNNRKNGKAKKSPANESYERDLGMIKNTLNNHMNDYNKRLNSIEVDIKIIKSSLEDIKIAIKK